MNTNLQSELEIQTQNFKGLIADYCRLESVAAQNRMMTETADWVEDLLKETGFQTRQLGSGRRSQLCFRNDEGPKRFHIIAL